MTTFNFQLAQDYESAWGTKWLRIEGQVAVRNALAHRQRQEFWMPEPYPTEFFVTSTEAEAFYRTLPGKRLMDIGCGPLPPLCSLSTHARDTYLLDPLILQYDSLVKSLFGETWSQPNVHCLIPPHNDFLPNLRCAIDGLLVCHNTLDHSDNPWAILESLSHYTAPGCALMFWTDVHYHFTPDAGHHSIAASLSPILSRLEPYFNIQRVVPTYPHHNTLHYGCFAVRR